MLLFRSETKQTSCSCRRTGNEPDNILNSLLHYLETRANFLLDKVVTDLHLH